MHIAMIGHKQIQGCEGGIEKAVRDLSGRFAERGHTVTVYDRKVLFSAAKKPGRESRLDFPPQDG